MRALATGIARLLLAGVATCAVATCHHDVPPLTEPPLREAPPMGATPEHPPLAPIADPTTPTTPTTGEKIGAPVPRPCGEDRPCQLDAGVTPGAPSQGPATSFEDRLPMRAQPAAVAPNKPPLDAGIDGPVSLPPVPDAGPPIIRDAAMPM
jgi:hypothetical protein